MYSFHIFNMDAIFGTDGIFVCIESLSNTIIYSINEAICLSSV